MNTVDSTRSKGYARSMTKPLAALVALILIAASLSPFPLPSVHAQSASGGSNAPILDPCGANTIAKSSAPINIATAATTSLVAVSGTTSVYVCGFAVTISEVVTTANTIQFEYGTGAACSGPVVLTGLFGAGGVTAGAPIVVSEWAPTTMFKAPSANGICAVTAIGGSGTFQGVMTYVQQ